MPRDPGRPGAPKATIGLIAACLVVFLVVWVLVLVRADDPLDAALRSLWAIDDVELLARAGALVASEVWLDHAWWRLASAGLLHGSWLHLAVNGWALWIVGSWTERVWGPGRQLALFALASLGGCLASLAWAEAPIVVGASAGIFGVAGALVMVRAFGAKDQQKKVEPVSAKILGGQLVFWLVVGALLPLFGVELLAQAGHLGGLVMGCLVGLAFSRPPEHRLSRGLLWAGVVGYFALGVALGVRPSWRANYHSFMGTALVERGQLEDALAAFEHAIAEHPEDAGLHNYVAYSLAEGGVELERAEEFVRVALEAEPENADYLDTLGWIQCKLGETEAGIESLEAAERAAEREIPEIEEHLERCGGFSLE